MNRQEIQALFFVDVGPKAGLGHLHRCLVLAAELRARGAVCRFVIEPESTAEAMLRAAGFCFHLQTQWWDPLIGAQLHEDFYDVAVLDSYHVVNDWLKWLRQRAAALVYIDDHDQIPDMADVVVQIRPEARQGSGENEANSRVDARKVEVSRGPIIFRGARYALLAEPFRQAKLREEVAPEATRFLLTIGGTDHHHLLPQLVWHLLPILGPDDNLKVVIGPYFKREEGLEEPVDHRIRQVHIVTPKEMAELMQWADVAVTAGGQSLYEMAAAGLPAVAIQVAKNQRRNIDGFQKVGTIRFAGTAGDRDLLEKVASMVAALKWNPGARKQMAERGQKIVDGLAVAELIKAIIGNTGRRYSENGPNRRQGTWTG